MDEIIEGFFKAIAGLLRFIFVSLLMDFVFYYAGKGTLMLVTAGSYPPVEETKTTVNFTVFIGILVSVALFVLVIIFADRIRYGI
ncbi:MAG: hypothetical protein V7739_18300 [Motiliproteus sp.]